MCVADTASVVVQSARPEDVVAMARLSGQLGYPVATDAFGERLAYLAARPENAIFVAKLNDEVVGWAHVGGRVLLESAPFAEILGLIVDEIARNRGIGARLVAACLDWARVNGWRQIRVRSNVIRADAHRFYERQGFSVSKRQAVFVLLLDQELVV